MLQLNDPGRINFILNDLLPRKNNSLFHLDCTFYERYNAANGGNWRIIVSPLLRITLSFVSGTQAN